MKGKKGKYPSEKEMQKFDFSKKKLTPANAMRLKCLDCCGFVQKEVRLCPCKNCPLYPYRLGVGSDKIKSVTLPQMRITDIE